VIPPTIIIRQGHKFNLMVQRDMVLPPSATR
jgi:type IV secretory pathway VirB10-like protein